MARFPIRFTGPNRALVVLGTTRSNSSVDVDDTTVTVQMGWSFRSHFPRSAVVSAAPDTGRVTGWGAHGWRGVWLVNGSSSGIVRIELDPEQRARCIGWPVRLRVLRVAVDDPAGLIAALTPTPR